MTRPALVFWSLVALLFGASLWFGLGVEAERRALTRAQAALQTGDLVTLGKVIDGDTIQVRKDGEDAGIVRLLGIKSFSTRVEKDVAAEFGRAAEEELRRLAEGHSLRVLLHTLPKDRHGRTLATLYADEQDVGLELVRRGLAIVYSVYPFPSITLYAEEQARARTERRGLWAHPQAAGKAEALIKDFRKRAP